MTHPETLLTQIRKAGLEKRPLDNVYQAMIDRDLFLMAYARIARNPGALAPGLHGETADGMSLARVDAIVDQIRTRQYTWTPARRIYLEKKGSDARRPIGLLTWSDKLVQEAMRLILNAYYDPQFSPRSHGYRPGRGPGTALNAILEDWHEIDWFVEGDIRACFDTLHHGVLMDLLSSRIHDREFLSLIHGALHAGYLEESAWNPGTMGSPQGAIVSPILCNVYLDQLDRFVESSLLNSSATSRTGGRRRHLFPFRSGQSERETEDGSVCYVRFADDFLLGIRGSRERAERIKTLLRDFLRKELRLELSETKTLITDARCAPARFLGYDLQTLDGPRPYLDERQGGAGAIALTLPAAVLTERCSRYMHDGQPVAWVDLEDLDPFDIVASYSVEFRSFVSYYRLAHNLWQAHQLEQVMEGSLVRTLAARLGMDVAGVYTRYQVLLSTSSGPRPILRVARRNRDGTRQVAQWGNTPMQWQPRAALPEPGPVPEDAATHLIDRLLADTCERCGSRNIVEVHQVRRARPLEGKRLGAMRLRHHRAMVVCQACHRDLHRRRRRTAGGKSPKAARPPIIASPPRPKPREAAATAALYGLALACQIALRFAKR